MSLRYAFMLLVIVLLAACTGGVADRNTANAAIIGGDPERGRQVFKVYGCGGCHHIPGVTGATAWVGPPLDDFDRRHYIAGQLTNTPDNLVRWLRFPQEIAPGTAMPDMNVSEQDARDMAAYLLRDKQARNR